MVSRIRFDAISFDCEFGIQSSNSINHFILSQLLWLHDILFHSNLIEKTLLLDWLQSLKSREERDLSLLVYSSLNTKFQGPLISYTKPISIPHLPIYSVSWSKKAFSLQQVELLLYLSALRVLCYLICGILYISKNDRWHLCAVESVSVIIA